MFKRKSVLIYVPIVLLTLHSIRAQTTPEKSESERLQKLERAVEQLQERNAELEQEVSSLKKQMAFAPDVDANGNKKPVVSDGKTYVEKSAATEEKKPVYITPAGPEYKLALGGYVQMNFEDGAVSAFEGRFPSGPNEIKDRFRLRRARINLIGDFAENFDFKVEGDFQNSDGISSGRTAFEATDIFVNWHQFPEANV